MGKSFRTLGNVPIRQGTNLWEGKMRSMTLAYLDPGTGSLLLQLFVGGLAGALAFLRYRWRSVKAIFARSHEDDQA